MHLHHNNPALAEARTAFPLKVRQVHEMKRLLQPAGQNNKIGKGDNVVIKGKCRGMPCFTLTLEERATCPPDCKQWSNCYGNNMRFAYRVDHRDPNELTRKLATEIKDILRTYRHRGAAPRPGRLLLGGLRGVLGRAAGHAPRLAHLRLHPLGQGQRDRPARARDEPPARRPLLDTVLRPGRADVRQRRRRGNHLP